MGRLICGDDAGNVETDGGYIFIPFGLALTTDPNPI